MKPLLHCLLVEDSEDDARLILHQLRAGGYEVNMDRVDTAEGLAAALARRSWDVVISDYRMPHFSGLDALTQVRASGRDVPFLLVSGTIGEDLAVEAMRAGAHDYLMKDRLTRLVPTVQRELREVISRAARRRAEASMRLQAEALAATANGILITDRDGQIVWGNPALAALTGYTLAEVVGRNPRALVKSGQHPGEFYAHMWRTITAGQTWHGRLINRRKDGSLYTEEQTITPVRGPDGEITHFIGIKQDITARVQAEEIRVAAERRYLAQRNALIRLGGNEGRGSGSLADSLRRITEVVCQTLDVARVGVWRFNEDRSALVGLDLYERATDRHSSGDIRAAADHSIYLQTLAESEIVAVHDPLDNPRTAELAHARLRPLGITALLDAPVHALGVVDSVLCVEHTGAPRVWTTDEETFAVAAANFVSLALEEWRREVAEADHRASEERYRQLFESNPVPLWLFDAETLRFLAVNEAAVAQYGYSREEFLAMTILDIRPPEGVEKLTKFMADRGPGPTAAGEWKHRRKEGSVLTVEVVSRPLTFNGREARLVLVTDVTEKKLLEEKFLHTQRLESLGMLAAGIAHDLNNVLAPIMFVAPLLRPRLTEPSDLKILSTLESSAGRGAGLVKQILGFAHTNTGDLQVTQLKHLARDVANVIEETFPKSIQFKYSIAADLWPVQGNATHIHQILLNLCVNARDAMPQGGNLNLRAANRRLDAAEAGQLPGARPGYWVELTVTDTGTGMSPELLQKCWDPFFTTKGEKGTGLGLSTVRGIVTNHRGFIDARSEPGAGTTLGVFLPALADSAAADTGASAQAVPAGRGELILVVDDDPAIRDIVGVVLTSSGYRVQSCGDGLDALDLFGAKLGEISLVITDMDMPRMGGLALARALVQLRPDLPILAMSGLESRRSGTTDLSIARRVTSAFLAKPFQADDLLVAVHKLLHRAIAV